MHRLYRAEGARWMRVFELMSAAPLPWMDSGHMSSRKVSALGLVIERMPWLMQTEQYGCHSSEGGAALAKTA
jgi:hypothetical protein